MFVFSLGFHRGNLHGLIIQIWYMYATSPKMSVLSSSFHRGNLHRLTIQIWYMHATSPQRSVFPPSFHRGNLHRLIVHIWYTHATSPKRSVFSPSFHRGNLHGPIMDLSSTFGTFNTSKEIHSFAQFSQRKPAPTALLMIQVNQAHVVHITSLKISNVLIQPHRGKPSTDWAFNNNSVGHAHLVHSSSNVCPFTQFKIGEACQ